MTIQNGINANANTPLAKLAGGTGVNAPVANPTAGEYIAWDSSLNAAANNMSLGYATTATAAGTTVLTVASAAQQYFTGSTTQTVTMPVASTCRQGQSWVIVNNSTGVVTVQSSGGNSIIAMPANTNSTITCILNSGTSAASWNAENTSGVAGVNTITGTANQVIANQPSGAVILSLPQDIGTTSSPQFNAVSFSDTTHGIVGTPTDNNAASTYVGELISSNVPSGSAISLTTLTEVNITSISLTAGDWDLWGAIVYQPAATLSNTESCISQLSATRPTLPNGGGTNRLITSYANASVQQMPTGTIRVSVGSTTTFYLVGWAAFTSTCTAYGYLGARRRR